MAAVKRMSNILSTYVILEQLQTLYTMMSVLSLWFIRQWKLHIGILNMGSVTIDCNVIVDCVNLLCLLMSKEK